MTQAHTRSPPQDFSTWRRGDPTHRSPVRTSRRQPARQGHRQWQIVQCSDRAANSTPSRPRPGSRPMWKRCGTDRLCRTQEAEGLYGETEELLTRIGVGEYLAQIYGGHCDEPGRNHSPERFRPPPDAIAKSRIAAIDELIATAITSQSRPAGRTRRSRRSFRHVGAPGLDETLEANPGGIRKFAEAEVVPQPMNGI